MKHEPHSLALLRALNPVTTARVSADSPQARAAFERIVAETRTPAQPGRRAAGAAVLGRLRVPRFQLAAGSCLAVLAALIVVLVVISGSTASPAFAGWSATPTTPSPGQVAASLRSCDSLVPSVIVDTRGPYTAAVFGGRKGGVACLEGPTGSAAGGLAGLTTSGHPVPAGQIQEFVMTGSNSKGAGFVLLAGRVGSGVTGVTIHRRGGGDIVATVRHGWYLAWWPAHIHVIAATVTGTHGSHTIHLPVAATQPSVSCGGPPNSGCSSVGGSGAGGSALGGPPLIQGGVQRPFRSVLLILVSNAVRVQLCVHAGTMPAHPPVLSPSITRCTQARLLSKLPRAYPVQRNLLTMFQDSVWSVKLPRGLARRIAKRHAFYAYATAFALPRWGGSMTGGFGLGWPAR